jgi:multiple sugar transport system permease protein
VTALTSSGRAEAPRNSRSARDRSSIVRSVRSARGREIGRTVLSVLVVALFLFPVYWMIVSALKVPGQLFSSHPIFLPHPAIWGDFRKAFDAAADGIKNSLIIALIAMAVTLVVAVPAAYALAKSGLHPRSVRWILITLIVVQVLPTIMLLTPLYEVASRVGLLNNYFTVGVVDALYAVPFCVLVLRAYMNNIPGILREAAIVDGASENQVFLRVILPNAKPGLATIAIFSFLFAWGDFIFGLTFTSGPSVEPASVVLYSLIGSYYSAWSEVMSMGTLLAIPAVIVVVLAQRLLQQGVTGFGVER